MRHFLFSNKQDHGVNICRNLLKQGLRPIAKLQVAWEIYWYIQDITIVG